jgi:GNAT superfamily N-acetyltransferase
MSAPIAPYRIRRATVDDVAVVTRHRVAMFRDMGSVRGTAIAPLEAGSARYLARALASGEYRGWLAELDGVIVAGAGVVLRPLLPRPGHPDGGTEAYVLNVYTDDAHRRRGLARGLMEAIVVWSRTQGVSRVTLHASDAGRPLYAALGFTATTEMGWDATG